MPPRNGRLVIGDFIAPFSDQARFERNGLASAAGNCGSASSGAARLRARSRRAIVDPVVATIDATDGLHTEETATITGLEASGVDTRPATAAATAR